MPLVIPLLRLAYCVTAPEYPLLLPLWSGIVTSKSVLNKAVVPKVSPDRRYLGVFLPLLSCEAIRHKPPDTPFVLTIKQSGAVRIVAADARTLALGIIPGMTVADARARVPELAATQHDPKIDADLLDWLADGCDRFTPIVALDPPCGLILDITGCTHFYSEGEAGLSADLTQRIARHGLTVRIACAATPDAAMALAEYGVADPRALPVSALRLANDVHIALNRAGLQTIGDLAARPRAPLAARFGNEAPFLLARLLGEVDVRITPRRVPSDLVVERRFAEPVARTADMLSTLDQLVQEAGTAMSQRAQGGRRFEASLFRSDGHVARLAVETGAPTRDPALLNRLLVERIDSLSDPLDPGFGYDLIRLAVAVVEPLAAKQLTLEGSSTADTELAALLDRLGVRLGSNRIRRLSAGNSHIPENACLSVPVAQSLLPLHAWPKPEPDEPPLRPLHLFDPPQRIQVIAEVPDGPPRRFRWQRSTYDIIAYEGPERIAAEWWKRRSMGGLTRDYYRVEDVQGRHFWVFCHGLYGSEKVNPDWYLHGRFA
jgi:protein ImuB